MITKIFFISEVYFGSQIHFQKNFVCNDVRYRGFQVQLKSNAFHFSWNDSRTNEAMSLIVPMTNVSSYSVLEEKKDTK